jgi:hypothetical protein
VAAPVDHSGIHLAPGSTARVDVVVRTRTIGHFFPGGTVDAFDVWLELEAKDSTGRVIFWSGSVEDNGKGPVEPGAHFYRSYQLDGEGNMINKRNAWQARSVLYVRLIPPGAADVAHYRVKIPKDAKGPINFRTPASPSSARIRNCFRRATTACSTASIRTTFPRMYPATSRTASRISPS